MKNKNLKIKRAVAAVTSIFFFFPIAALAYTLLEPLPGGEGGAITEITNLSDYLNWIFRFALAAAAFLAVIKIVIGGIMIMTGGASESSVTKGREMISMAIWGLLLAISSVLILTTINPNLVKNTLDIPPTKKIQSPKTGGGAIGGQGEEKVDCIDPPKVPGQCVPGRQDCEEGYTCQSTGVRNECGYTVWRCVLEGGGGEFGGGGTQGTWYKK